MQRRLFVMLVFFNRDIETSTLDIRRFYQGYGFAALYAEPDPAFHFIADPDLDLSFTSKLIRSWILLLMQTCDHCSLHTLQGFTLDLRASICERLRPSTIKLLNFDFNADPDFHSIEYNTVTDPTSENNLDPDTQP
jgi:hypothetical protein